MPKKYYDELAAIKRARKRREQVLRYRNQGLTLQQIADKYGVSRERARQLWRLAEKEAMGHS